MIIRQTDVNSNANKYMELAGKGEIVVVTGTGNSNIVILSESTYVQLQEAQEELNDLKARLGQTQRMTASDEQVIAAYKKIVSEYRETFEELAK